MWFFFKNAAKGNNLFLPPSWTFSIRSACPYNLFLFSKQIANTCIHNFHFMFIQPLVRDCILLMSKNSFVSSKRVLIKNTTEEVVKGNSHWMLTLGQVKNIVTYNLNVLVHISCSKHGTITIFDRDNEEVSLYKKNIILWLNEGTYQK